MFKKIKIKLKIKEWVKFRKSGFDLIESLNNTPYTVNTSGDEDRTILRYESDEIMKWFGRGIGICFPVMTGFGKVWAIVTDSYVKEVENLYFRYFIEYHEQGHIVLGHLDSMESQSKFHTAMLSIQAWLGIGKGNKIEEEADEYAASIIGYNNVIECLELMNKTFNITLLQSLQINARIRNLKKKMVE